MAEKEEKVRYRVTGQCFVGGNFVDPKGRTDVYVYDAPGLAGPSLELAPVEAAPAPAMEPGGAGLSDPARLLEREAELVGLLAAEREKVERAHVTIARLTDEIAAANEALLATNPAMAKAEAALKAADEANAALQQKVAELEKQLAAAKKK